MHLGFQQPTLFLGETLEFSVLCHFRQASKEVNTSVD